MKRRAIPTSIAHPSVGTEEDIAARLEARKQLDQLQLTRSLLSHLVMSTDTMKQWGYITEVPHGDGGSEPHLVGHTIKCERCNQSYKVTPTPTHDECTYHWGRPFSRTINGVCQNPFYPRFPSKPFLEARNCAYTHAAQRPQVRTAVQEDFMSIMNLIQTISISVIHFPQHDPQSPAMVKRPSKLPLMSLPLTAR